MDYIYPAARADGCHCLAPCGFLVPCLVRIIPYPVTWTAPSVSLFHEQTCDRLESTIEKCCTSTYNACDMFQLCFSSCHVALLVLFQHDGLYLALISVLVSILCTWISAQT